jgi:hypothetical protein
VYSVTEHDRVHELPDVRCPSSEAPKPVVLADEETLVIAYASTAPLTGPAADAGPIPAAPAGTTIVVFHQCYACHFGLPNDEAFATHPLADRGLRPYGAFEVEHSSWLRGLAMRNRAHAHHDPERFQRLRHWVWTFHDSVLECAALGYETVDVTGRPDEAVPRMHALLSSSIAGRGELP